MSGTSENVSKFATEKDALDLRSMSLLGTMIEPDGPKALIRMSSGNVQKVGPGDRLGLSQVRAIATGMVQISSLGGLTTLKMPEG